MTEAPIMLAQGACKNAQAYNACLAPKLVSCGSGTSTRASAINAPPPRRTSAGRPATRPDGAGELRVTVPRNETGETGSNAL
jgi:hypothetical protein